MLTRCKPLLGTLVEITVPESAAGAVDGAFASIADVHAIMSFHDEGSDLAALRRAPVGTSVRVAPATVEVLRVALDLHRESGGLFDVTIGRELVRAGFLPRPEGPLPSSHPGTSADIEIIDDCHVRCHRPMLIDLGGIAKGYAVDRAVAGLRTSGVGEGLVNAGGDMRMFGPREWQVQLRDGDGAVRSGIALADCAIASSANRNNRRRRWGRTQTPHIGVGRMPVITEGRISVIAERCIIADAMTKVVMADPATAQAVLVRYGARACAEAPLGWAA